MGELRKDNLAVLGHYHLFETGSDNILSVNLDPSL